MDDEDLTLAQLQARARRKATRRLLQTSAAVVPAVILMVALTPVTGWLQAGVLGCLAGAGVAILLERRFGSADE